MNIEVPRERIEAFCRKWKISELALFGSVLRDDFRPDSDVDVLVTFAPDARHSLFDVSDMHEELREMFGREVDLVQKKLIENPFIRHHVLATYQTLYAAA
jgi:predicted nucleotidyltransferase